MQSKILSRSAVFALVAEPQRKIKHCDQPASISIAGLTEADVRIVYPLVEHLRRSHTGS